MFKVIRWFQRHFQRKEYRCSRCAFRDSCPAAFTGVLYPCHYFIYPGPYAQEYWAIVDAINQKDRP